MGLFYFLLHDNSAAFLILFHACLAAVSFWFLIKRRNKATESKMLPPSPFQLPLIGNLHQLRGLPHQSLQNLSTKYGPIMFLKLGSIPNLVISSADIAREVFKNHDLVFSDRPQLYAAKKLSYNCSDVTFAPYGKYWREMRKIVMLELLSAKRVQSFEAVRDEEVTLLIQSIACSSGPVDFSELLPSFANNVICRVAFGKKYVQGGTDDMKGLSEMLAKTESLLGGFCLTDFFPWLEWLNKFNGLDARIEKTFRELDAFYDKVIEEHLHQVRPKAEREDLIDVLLRVQQDPSQEISLTNEQIKGIIADLFIGGTDTSSATIEWTMAELIKHPSAMTKAQEEIREVVKGKTKVEESDLSSLVYLKSVIKEAMRLHSPNPLLLPRETTKTCTINGYTIPAGTRVTVNARAILVDPKHWKDPYEFFPERFLNSSIDFKGQHFEMIPFGVGRRICPGINYATLLIELTLANLLLRFDWKIPDGGKIEDVSMEEAFGLAVHKKVPLRLVAIPAKL